MPLPFFSLENDMLKIDILVKRHPDMAHEQFVAYWKDAHAKLFATQPIVKMTVRRYVQSRIVRRPPDGLRSSAFDGIAQLWFDDINGFLSYASSDNYRDIIRIDEQKFIDLQRTEFIFSEETAIFLLMSELQRRRRQRFRRHRTIFVFIAM
jgi:uncharacterized protein (TIGR02118 family)